MAIGRSVRRLFVVLAVLTATMSCGRDLFRERTDAIKTHSKAFYAQLEKDQVPSAVRENEEVEAVATAIARDIRRRPNQPGANQVDREWVQYKTASEAAVENWLALAKYFTIKKRYEQARATYQRILENYPRGLDRRYADQAEQGLKALPILEADPSTRSSRPVD